MGGIGRRRAPKSASFAGFDILDNSAFQTDDYTLLEAMVGYRFGSIDLQLSVSNLTDKEYTVAISDDGLLGASSYAGPGHFVGVTARYRF